MPVSWCLADPILGKREVAAVLLGHARDQAAVRASPNDCLLTTPES
jgi:hypothetical protein